MLGLKRLDPVEMNKTRFFCSLDVLSRKGTRLPLQVNY